MAWMRLSYIWWNINPFVRKRLLFIGNNTENIQLYQTAETHRGAMLFSEADKDASSLGGEGIRRCVPESDYKDSPADDGLEKNLRKQIDRTLSIRRTRSAIFICAARLLPAFRMR